MFDTDKYVFEIILEHILVCEKRFNEINLPSDFIKTEFGNTLQDAIVTRLQAVGENLKRLFKQSDYLSIKYPEIEWEKIIKFRDFIAHHYELLDYEIIFDICQFALPKLKKVILQELNSNP